MLHLVDLPVLELYRVLVPTRWLIPSWRGLLPLSGLLEVIPQRSATTRVSIRTQTVWYYGRIPFAVSANSLEFPRTDSRRCYSPSGGLRIPVDQLKSRISKVNLCMIKACCNLYLPPESQPGSGTVYYSVVAGRFRSVQYFYLALRTLSSLRTTSLSSHAVCLLPYSSSLHLTPHNGFSNTTVSVPLQWR